MILTDTHTHLYVEQFDKDRVEIVQKAIDNNITRFFIPAIDSFYYKAMFSLKKQFPDNIFLMSGLHPTHVKENFKEELEVVKKMLLENKFYAVGEIGIDLYWDKSFLQQQQDAFKFQISLAKENKLPIVIHCRDAFDEIFEILDDEKDERLFGIFHCFTGSFQQAEQAISLGMKLGIGGVVTFKNGKIDQFLNKISIEDIVLETDSPYLAPIPHRGKRNESSYLSYIVDKLVNIYGMTPEEIAGKTTENSKKIFGV
jgi:TatD DNase family protein